VLAAGGSSRLGRPKQLVRVRAAPLIARAVAQAERLTGERVVIVIGAEAQRLRSVLIGRARGTAVVCNRRWREGLAGSLRLGIDALPPRAEAAFVLLCDQPRIPDASLRRMARRWRARPHVAVAAAYAGRLGVPAILPKRAWSAVRRLEGDAGARGLLNAMREVTAVDVPEAAFDVDTPDDLRGL
jgi:molybdenum cofactor cytidylyltransferase